MDTQGFKNYAFISYQRKDEKWAKWLQRKLENYKLPAVARGDSSDKAKYIRPVFRDKTDLTGGILSEELKKELRQSRYLIVLCSPNSASSSWVNEEVKTFIQDNRIDAIIPFILKGTPHADILNDECFPLSLREIPPQKEVLGIDVRDSGKDRAFIRTVAYMLGVRFDELWDRHKRQTKRLHYIEAAACFLSLLVVISIYDYKRIKVEYYADWVDCWGVAHGIHQLTPEEYAHRHHSFKFEYKRVPFGEEDFYSWRLVRVSLVNSKGVISDFEPDNHTFFYPVQEFFYTDGYVSEIINRDSYNRIINRYTVKDDESHNHACLVDIEGAEKRQGSAYLNSSTTALYSRQNASSSMSKIKRFHYSRNDSGFITEVSYHANDSDNLEESAISDNNSIYGKLFELDVFGRIQRVIYVNKNGSPTTDKYGISQILFSNSAWGKQDTTSFTGIGGSLAMNEHKYARKITTLDCYGNPVEEINQDVTGNPCYDYQGCYRQVIKYNEDGFFTEISNYNLEGDLSYDNKNIAIQRVQYDSRGRYICVSHFDPNNNPCYIEGNYSILRFKYNSNDCIIEQSAYDIYDMPCAGSQENVHRIRIELDENNYLTAISYYDINNQLTSSPMYHFARATNRYDEYHRLIERRFYGADGTPCFSDDFASVLRWSYDTRGNVIREECFDDSGHYCISKHGYAVLAILYDSYGNEIEESYFGVEGEPVYIGGVAKIHYAYERNGLVREQRNYDENGSLCLNDSWWSIGLFDYDSSGQLIEASYWDQDSTRCVNKDGLFSVLLRKWDSSGNVIREEYYDSNFNLNHSASIREFQYDNRHNIIEESYFAKEGVASLCENGWHSCRVSYDLRNNVIKRSYFGVDGRPCNLKQGFSVYEMDYDDYGYLICSIQYDSKGNLTNNLANGNCSHKILYDDRHRITEESFYDNNGSPCWFTSVDDPNLGYFSRICYLYDERNNVIERQYYSPDGMLTMAAGQAVSLAKYDNLGRVIGMSALDENRHPCNGYQIPYSSDQRKYNSFNKVSEEIRYDINESPIVKIIYKYDSRGRLVGEEYRDAKDSLMILNDIHHNGYAKKTAVYNSNNLITNIFYYNQSDKVHENGDGVAEERYSFDRFGRTIMLAFYDSQGVAIESSVNHFHKRVSRYNERGQMVKDSYYLSDGLPAIETPWGYSSAEWYYDTNGERERYCQYVGERMIYDTMNTIDDSVWKDVIFARVERPGQFKDAGLNGAFYLLEWCNWSIGDSFAQLSEEFGRTNGSPKHLVLCPVLYENDAPVFDRVFERDFDEKPLGVALFSMLVSENEYESLMEIYHTYREKNENTYNKRD